MSDAKAQDIREATDALKFLSQTHRTLHDQRRKVEFQVLLTSISFYVLAVAARFSDKVTLPTSGRFTALVWVVCIGLSIAASAFLLRLHKANLTNITLAEQAENAIIKAWSCDAFTPPSPSASQREPLWFFLGWLWQTIVLFFFAVVCSLLLILV